MKIGREFYFDAAHSLPDYQGKCEQLHGHTYKLEVVVEGKVKEDGMVIDFTDLKKVVNEKILEKLDHGNLNGLFKNPTAEKIAEWIFQELKKEIFVSSVKLWEGKGKWVSIENE